MERNEFQTRTKLESQLSSAERELALAKKKLEHEEEERDKRRIAWEQRVMTQYNNNLVLISTTIYTLHLITDSYWLFFYNGDPVSFIFVTGW